MNPGLEATYPGYVGSPPSIEQRQRVMRNTYWLLSLSMVPTVLGAWIGVSTGLVTGLSPLMSLIVFFVGAFGLMFLIQKTRNSAMGVASLLAFTFFMGLMLSRMLAFTLLKSNGASLIMLAFSGTGLIFFGMAALSTVIKRDLSSMGKFLFIGLIMVMVASIANMFLHSTVLFATLSALSIGIFSAFIVYDLRRIQDGQETNYVMATLSVYLNLYNIFQSLLSLFTAFGGDD